MTDWSAVQRDEARKVYEAEIAGLRKELEVARSALANATKARKTKMPAPAATRRRSGSDIVRVVIPDTHGCLIDKGALACRMAPERTDAVIDTLRRAGVSIRAVQPERLTLEASFIDMIVAQSRGGAQ